MKKVLNLALIILAFKAQAQVDSSTLKITLNFKVKHIQYMASVLYTNSSIADARYRDSLIKYMGSGNNIDSVVTTHFTAGVVYKFVQNLMSEQDNVAYAMTYELFNGAAPFTGLLTQLFTKGATPDSEQGVSKYLFAQVANWYSLGNSIMTNKLNNGKTWLSTPIIYN